MKTAKKKKKKKQGELVNIYKILASRIELSQNENSDSRLISELLKFFKLKYLRIKFNVDKILR